MSFIKNSAAAIVAWNVSSWVTIGQLAVAMTVFPRTYESTMGFANRVIMGAWDFTCVSCEVLWEFLNFP